MFFVFSLFSFLLTAYSQNTLDIIQEDYVREEVVYVDKWTLRLPVGFYAGSSFVQQSGNFVSKYGVQIGAIAESQWFQFEVLTGWYRGNISPTWQSNYFISANIGFTPLRVGRKNRHLRLSLINANTYETVDNPQPWLQFGGQLRAILSPIEGRFQVTWPVNSLIFPETAPAPRPVWAFGIVFNVNDLTLWKL